MNSLPVFLLVLAILLLWIAGRQRRRLGVPEGSVLYQDTERGQQLEQPLYAADLGLTGRPDYLVKSAQGLVPVEVKSGRSPGKPYDSHIYQLAAYCALVERAYGERPTYGIIRYPERSFQVEYSPQLEHEFLELLGEMRGKLALDELSRSHTVAARCRSCGFLDRCEQSL
jgi:CRISPR-associated exonuclease Cas4